MLGHMAVIIKTSGIPFWGRCTSLSRTYLSGDWDVHWGYDLDFDPWPHPLKGWRERMTACSLCTLTNRTPKSRKGGHFICEPLGWSRGGREGNPKKGWIQPNKTRAYTSETKNGAPGAGDDFPVGGLIPPFPSKLEANVDSGTHIIFPKNVRRACNIFPTVCHAQT